MGFDFIIHVVIGSHAYSCMENVECTGGQHNGFYVLSLRDMWSAQRQFGTLTLGISFASVNVYNLHALLVSLRGARKANSAHLRRVLHASMNTYDLNKLFASGVRGDQRHAVISREHSLRMKYGAGSLNAIFK